MPSDEGAFAWSEQDTRWMTETIDPSFLAATTSSNDGATNTTAHYNTQASNQHADNAFTACGTFFANNLIETEQQIYTALHDTDASPQTIWSVSAEEQGSGDSTNITPSSSASPFEVLQHQVDLQPKAYGTHHANTLRQEHTHHAQNTHTKNPNIPAKRRRGRPRIYPQSSSDHSNSSERSSLISHIKTATLQHHATAVSHNPFDPRQDTPAVYHEAPASQNDPENNVSEHQHTGPSERQQTASAPPRRPRGRPPIYPRPPNFSTSPTPPSPLTLTRESNRLAAQRFRMRQDTYTSNLTSEAEELEGKNKELKREVKELREKVIELKYGVLKHGEGGCREVLEGVVGNVGGGGGGVRREDGGEEEEKEGEGDEIQIEDKVFPSVLSSNLR
jgi:hypothetical protein